LFLSIVWGITADPTHGREQRLGAVLYLEFIKNPQAVSLDRAERQVQPHGFAFVPKRLQIAYRSKIQSSSLKWDRGASDFG